MESVRGPTAMSVAEQADADGPDGVGLSREVAFDVLSSQRRRHVLHYLLQDDAGEAQLRDLTTRIAAWENDTTPEEVTSKQRMRVYTALRQSHLPKMDREGVVVFDPVSGSVELTEDASQLEVYLDVVPHDEIPWSDFYLGLGVLGLGVVTLLWLEVVPFALVPDLGWAGLFAAALAASGAVHKARARRMKLGRDGSPPA